MKTIMRIKFGSHLYGTATPKSDEDFKSIFIPDARSILLQRAKGVLTNQRPEADGEKNVAGEVDEERFSLQRYLGLLAEGQTVAVDVLFAPKWARTEPCSPIWEEIVANRSRLLTGKSAAFVGYVKTQASKYGIRGSRVAAARAALGLLSTAVMRHGYAFKLHMILGDIMEMVATTEHMSIVNIPNSNGADDRHWEVCNRKLPFTASIGSAHDILDKVVREYGHRALAAERNEGVDWKALSHAVRIAQQALELLSTGHVTFPRPNTSELIAIKLGERPYKHVAEQIESLLVEVEAAALASSLRDEPDLEWIDDLVAEVYRTEVITHTGLI